MRHQYRVTKYDPGLRGIGGAFARDEWTSYSDVGRTYNGVALSASEYLRVENAYLLSVEEFLSEAGVETLQLRALENKAGSALPTFVRPLAQLTIPQCVEFARIVLREIAWGKLASPARAYVHFGWDFYMYIGLPKKCPNAIVAAQSRGLFVENFRSPYLRAR